MEEVDAERMLAELVRMTRPGGRIGVVVRASTCAVDESRSPDEVRRAAERVSGAGADADGCADASLYRRFVAVGLHDLSWARSTERIRPNVRPSVCGCLSGGSPRAGV